MKKTEITQKSISSLIIGAVTILAMIVFFGSSFGWFTSIKSVENKDLELKADDDDSIRIIRMIVYKYRVDEGRVTAVMDDPSSPQFMQLNQYDTVFVERQAYTPMIVKIPLEKTQGAKFRIDFSCVGDLYEEDESSGKHLANNISNVITVRCGISSTLDKVDNDETTATSENFFAEAKRFLEDPAKKTAGIIGNNQYSEQQFVSYTLSGNQVNVTEKKSVLTYEFDNYSISGQELNIYMMIDYDKNLVNRYVAETIGTVQTDTLGDNVIRFDRDLDTIFFSRDDIVNQDE